MKYLSSPQKLISEVRTFRLRDRSSIISVLVYIAIFISMLSPFFGPSRANAAVTESFVRFDRLSTSATSITGTACLKTGTSGTENGVVIDFPTGWTVPTAGSWSVTTTNLPVDPADNTTAATAWPAVAAGTISVSGLSVRIAQTTSMDLTTTVFYCFNFTGTGGAMTSGNDQKGALKTTGGSPYVDNSVWATSIVGTNADQITVSASVSASLTFSLGANTAALSTLVTSGTPTAATPVTQSVITNAHNGWESWVKSTNGALTSAQSSGSITSSGSFDGAPSDLSGAGAGYVLDVNTNSGTATINAEYNGTGDSNFGGFLDTQFHQTAQHTATPTVTDIVNLVVRAKAAATTPAAIDYTDTLTIVVAGNF